MMNICSTYLESSLDFQSLWSNDHPRFTPCFEKTILVWIPCILVFLFLPCYACNSNPSSRRKWSWKGCRLCFARKICLALIFLISLIRLIGTVVIGLTTHGFVDIAEVLTMALMSESLLVLLRCSSRSSNSLHAINIGVFCIFGIPEICSKIGSIHTGDHHYSTTTFDIILYFLLYIGFWISFIVYALAYRHSGNCFQAASNQNANVWPERKSSFFVRIFFSYMWRLYIKGYRKTMDLSDLWTIDSSEEASHVNDKFMHRYKKLAEKYKLKPGGLLALTAFLEHWKAFLISFILIVARELFAFVVLLDLRWLIGLASNPHEPRWHGYVYVGIFFICQLCRILTWHHKHHEFTKIGIRLRSALASFVLKKSLRLSPNARREFGAGAITNLASMDAGQFGEHYRFIHLVWSAPITLCLGVYFLYTGVGHACWLGLTVICLTTFLNILCGKYYNKIYGQEMMHKDKRIKLIAELLRIIRVVKLYAWELAFKKFIDQIRANEVSIVKKLFYISGLNDITWCSTTLLAMVSIFGLYTLGFGYSLTPEVAFPLIIVFYHYFIPLGWVPRCINGVIAISTSFKRLDKFFAAEELDNYVETSDMDRPGMAISIKDASYTWDHESTFDLRNISADIRQGQLIAVIGTVGAGKSSLLNAIAGEMYQTEGTTKIAGSMAYVPQQSWILNETLRGNILFNKEFDADRYEKVIKACALKPDFELLPAKDMTEIGERGINLSGGQKQRVSLARAVYQDKDIYLLDDPLSAVDVHVQKHLFNHVIGPHGLLKNKTRIFVTNATSFLPMCDQVVLMDEGKIIDFGPFKAMRKASVTMIQDIEGIARKRSSVDELNRKISLLKMPELQKPKEAEQVGKLVAQEGVATGMVSWSSYWLYFKSAGWAIFIAFFWKALALLCNMIAFLWVQHWTDSVARAKNNTTSTIPSDQGIYVLGILCVIQLILGVLFVISSGKFTVNAASILHSDLLMRMLKAPTAIFDSTPSGRFLNRFSQDINAIDCILGLSLQVLFVFLILFLTSVGPVIYACPFLAAFLITLAVILAVLQKFYSTSARQLQRLEAISRSPILSRLHDVLQGVDSIRIYSQQDVFASKLEKMLNANAAAKLCLLTSQRWLTVHLQLLSIIVSSSAVLVALYTNISPGRFGLVISCLVTISQAAQMVQTFCDTETAFVAMERVKEYLHLPQETSWTKLETVSKVKFSTSTSRKVAEDRTHEGVCTLASHYESNGIQPKLDDWPRTGAIEFRNYGLKYRPNLPFALRNINLKIEDGEKVGIVGRTGAGKTSITAGLFRLVESAEGEIIIDSVDIATLGLHELRQKLTIIPQDPSVFNGTIRQNLDPFNEYSDQEVWSALELSHLKPYVANLPDGIGHKLDEGGSNLSMGQRQLLCLARALLRRTKILIMDEATASVDMETDQLIQETLRTHFTDCTVITIAHRLETIMDYDSVVVLGDGLVLEHGQVKALLANPHSHFSRLANKGYQE